MAIQGQINNNKQKISREEVERVAHLAKLALSESEITHFQSQLSDILFYMEQLNEVDTSSVEPTFQVTGLENVFREDMPADSLSQAETLQNAPQTKNGFFKVKRVLE